MRAILKRDQLGESDHGEHEATWEPLVNWP